MRCGDKGNKEQDQWETGHCGEKRRVRDSEGGDWAVRSHDDGGVHDAVGNREGGVQQWTAEASDSVVSAAGPEELLRVNNHIVQSLIYLHLANVHVVLQDRSWHHSPPFFKLLPFLFQLSEHLVTQPDRLKLTFRLLLTKRTLRVVIQLGQLDQTHQFVQVSRLDVCWRRYRRSWRWERLLVQLLTN